jgi:transcriptional regulator with XRE-family HTH domain
MSPEQCRAARAWLNWSQDDLARKAQVSNSTVRDFEAGRRLPITNNLSAMRRALEDAGVRLVFGDDGAATGIAAQPALVHARQPEPELEPLPQPAPQPELEQPARARPTFFIDLNEGDRRPLRRA